MWWVVQGKLFQLWFYLLFLLLRLKFWIQYIRLCWGLYFRDLLFWRGFFRHCIFKNYNLFSLLIFLLFFVIFLFLLKTLINISLFLGLIHLLKLSFRLLFFNLNKPMHNIRKIPHLSLANNNLILLILVKQVLKDLHLGLGLENIFDFGFRIDFHAVDLHWKLLLLELVVLLSQCGKKLLFTVHFKVKALVLVGDWSGWGLHGLEHGETRVWVFWHGGFWMGWWVGLRLLVGILRWCLVKFF